MPGSSLLFKWHLNSGPFDDRTVFDHLNTGRVSDEHLFGQVINCQYSLAQMCTREDTLAWCLGAPSMDDVMSHNELTTGIILVKL